MVLFPTLASVAPKADSTPERKPEGKLKKGYNPSESDLLSKLRQSQEQEYSPDTFAGKTRHKGIVVFNPYQDGQKPIPGDYPVRVRVWIKELHKHLPPPKAAKNGQATISCQLAALYPEFVAPSLDHAGLKEQPKLGQELQVEFVDRFQTTHHYNNGYIVGTTGGWGAAATKLDLSPLQKQARDNCEALEKKFRAMEGPGGKKVNDPNSSPGGPPPPPLVHPETGKPPQPAQPPLVPLPEPDQGPSNRRRFYNVRTGKWQAERPPPASGVPAEQQVNPKKAECDTKYVLEQLRNQFDFVIPTSDQLDELKKTIWWDERTATEISKLHPNFRPQVIKMVKNLATQSDPLYVVTGGQGGIRTLKGQREIYGKGRDEGRKWLGTRTGATEGQSAHIYALAMDFREFKGPLPVIPGNSKASQKPVRVRGGMVKREKFSRWKGDINELAHEEGTKNISKLYRVIVKACQDAGMKSGVNFPTPDPGHCQIKDFKWREALKKVQAQDFIQGTTYIKL